MILKLAKWVGIALAALYVLGLVLIIFGIE